MDPARVQGLPCLELCRQTVAVIYSACVCGQLSGPQDMKVMRALSARSFPRPRGPWQTTGFSSAGPTGMPAAL